MDDIKSSLGSTDDATANAWESDTMVHKHLSRRRRRRHIVSPSLIEHSEATIAVTYEAQAKGNRWVTLKRAVTMDALMQSDNPTVMAGSLIESLSSKSIDACRDIGAEPTCCVSIGIKIGRHSQGFRCNDDAITWLTAIVIGGRYYDRKRVGR